MGKMVELECILCGKNFERLAAEHKRNSKKGMKIYCSLECCGKDNVDNFGDNIGKGDITHFGNKRYWGTIDDGWAGFREYLRRIRARKRSNPTREINITLEDLKVQWELQNGRCIYTKVILQHPRYTTECIATGVYTHDPLYTASLDRIDSSKGYIKGNIQFVAIAANFAKQAMTHEQMLEFCRIVRESKEPL